MHACTGTIQVSDRTETEISSKTERTSLLAHIHTTHPVMYLQYILICHIYCPSFLSYNSVHKHCCNTTFQNAYKYGAHMNKVTPHCRQLLQSTCNRNIQYIYTVVVLCEYYNSIIEQVTCTSKVTHIYPPVSTRRHYKVKYQ